MESKLNSNTNLPDLKNELISIPQSLDFKIVGGLKLSGSVATNYSKNGALGLLCAALLNKGKTKLNGIPRIEEVNRIIEVMKSIGVDIDWVGPNSVLVQLPEKMQTENINVSSASKTRAILMFMGPLIHHFNSFKLPNSQGCKMGKRTISAHIYGLESMGIKVKVEEKNYVISHKELKGSEIVMYESGDTAVENLLMAASLIPQKTVIKFASSNYMVQEVCFFLEKLGVKIDGVGTTTLTIHGLDYSVTKDIEYTNSEDPIESMMYISAAVTTGSEIEITRCPIDFLELELLKLEKMGLKYKLSKSYLAENERTKLVDIKIKHSKLVALDDKIYGRPFPGVNIDNLPFFVPIATQAKGTTLIHDWTWENRAIYFMELNRLGANMMLADPHRVYIYGPTKLKATQVVCPPALRPAMIILIAMLAAEGVSVLRNVYAINRGYESIVEKLNSIGAKIEVLNS